MKNKKTISLTILSKETSPPSFIQLFMGAQFEATIPYTKHQKEPEKYTPIYTRNIYTNIHRYEPNTKRSRDNIHQNSPGKYTLNTSQKPGKYIFPHSTYSVNFPSNKRTLLPLTFEFCPVPVEFLSFIFEACWFNVLLNYCSAFAFA